jgi:hypothetical protein
MDGLREKTTLLARMDEISALMGAPDADMDAARAVALCTRREISLGRLLWSRSGHGSRSGQEHGVLRGVEVALVTCSREPPPPAHGPWALLVLLRGQLMAEMSAVQERIDAMGCWNLGHTVEIAKKALR